MDDEFESETETYLCNIFGPEDRFVRFVNNTGRPVRLASELKMQSYANMTWSSTAIIHPFKTHPWRFLGDSPNLSIYFLSLLPDPYKLARTNSYSWKVSFVDSETNSEILIGSQIGRLELSSLKELGPGATTTLHIHNINKEPPPLKDLVLDKISLIERLGDEDLSKFGVPGTLENKLISLHRDYNEVFKYNKIEPCSRCNQIHI